MRPDPATSTEEISNSPLDALLAFGPLRHTRAGRRIRNRTGPSSSASRNPARPSGGAGHSEWRRIHVLWGSVLGLISKESLSREEELSLRQQPARHLFLFRHGMRRSNSHTSLHQRRERCIESVHCWSPPGLWKWLQ